jgi:hypothetical protein
MNILSENFIFLNFWLKKVDVLKVFLTLKNEVRFHSKKKHW